MKKVLTIGDGIAAWCLHAYLKDAEVTNFCAEDFFPSCSLNSTAINCLRGTQSGISPLGDLMVRSYQEFEKFYLNYKPEGIALGHEIKFFNDVEKHTKRYPNYYEAQTSTVQNYRYQASEPAYLIDPQELKKWFNERYQHVKKSDKLVTKLIVTGEKVQVETGGQTISYDEVYLCSSYATAYLARGLNPEFDTYLDYSKQVPGTYLEIPFSSAFKHFEQDVSLALGEHHLIVKPSQGKVLLGSTTTKDEIEFSDQRIKEIYLKVQSHLTFDLPNYSQWRVLTGIRHKGRKRTPYWGEIAPGVKVICGLYKNGYTFAFQAAKELTTSPRTPF